MTSAPLRNAYNFLAPLLRPFSFPYAFLMRQRRRLYGQGRLPAYAPSCPCLSVGNIAWGGTGKTPLVAWLLSWAQERGLRAVVFTRGYKGKPGEHPLLVRTDSPPERAGDEPLMLAHAFPDSFVLAHPARALSASYAQKHLAPDFLILDDGMQHLAVRRAFNIVLLRPEDLASEWNRVIPSGSWREGADALASASAFALKADPEEVAELEPLARRRLATFHKPLFFFSLVPVGLRPLSAQNGQGGDNGPRTLSLGDCAPLVPLEQYRDVPYILMSGVGNPSGVERTAARLMGRPPVQHFAFADHHPYSARDIQAVVKMSAAPLPVVCTAKDAVKLRPFASVFGALPVWVLETAVEFGRSLFCEESFPSWWQARWQEAGGTGAVVDGSGTSS